MSPHHRITRPFDETIFEYPLYVERAKFSRFQKSVPSALSKGAAPKSVEEPLVGVIRKLQETEIIKIFLL
jgi:hypothetical protein